MAERKSISNVICFRRHGSHFHLLHVIFVISLCPVGKCDEIDYIYGIDASEFDIEDGVDFETGGFQSVNFAKFNKIQKNMSSVVSFDIEVDKDDEDDRLGKNTEEKSSENVIGNAPRGENNKTNLFRGDSHSDLFKSKLSTTGDYVFGALLVGFGLMSLLGNGCVLFIFCFRHRGLTPAEVLLVNLGVVDILLAIASYPMAMIASFKHRWIFGERGCVAYAFVCYFLGVASIFSITAIAFIRYLKTCTPARGNQITCWTSCRVICWSYLVSFLWAGLPLIGFGNYASEPFGLSCTLDWVAKDKASRLYIVLVTIFCVFLPLLVIIFSYSRILVLVKQSNALLLNNGVNKRNTKGSDLQLTWISGLVTLGFIIGWGPYSVVSFWATFKGEVILPMWATPIPVLMAKSSIAYNPFIYIFLTARYREDFFELLQTFLHFHAKERKESIAQNNCRRQSSKLNAKKDDNDAAENSPGSSSLATRQQTTTSQLTPSHQPTTTAEATSLPYFGVVNRSFNNNNNILNNNQEEDNEGYSTNDDEESSNSLGQEASVFIFQENCNKSNLSHQQQCPRALVTMVKGTGFNSTTFSTTTVALKQTKAVSSSSLLYFHSESSSDENEEHQV